MTESFLEGANGSFERRGRRSSQNVYVDGFRGRDDGSCEILGAIHNASIGGLSALHTVGQAIQNGMNQDSTQIMSEIASAGVAGVNATTNGVSGVKETVVSQGLGNLNATYNAGNAVKDTVTQHGLRLGDGIQSSEARVSNALSQGFRDVGKDNCDTRDSVRTSAHDIERVASAGFGDVRRELCKEGSDVRDAVRTSGNATDRDVIENRAVIRDAAYGVERTVAAGTGDVRREVSGVVATLGREVQENRSVTREVGCDVKSAIKDGFGDLSRQISDGFGDSNYKNLQAEGRTRELVLASEGRTRELAQKGFYDAEIGASKNAAASALAAEKTRYDIEISASKNAAALEKCCCEAKIAADAQAALTRELFLKQEAGTRELFLKTQNDALAARLAACEQQNLRDLLLNGRNGGGDQGGHGHRLAA